MTRKSAPGADRGAAPPARAKAGAPAKRAPKKTSPTAVAPALAKPRTVAAKAAIKSAAKPPAKAAAKQAAKPTAKPAAKRATKPAARPAAALKSAAKAVVKAARGAAAGPARPALVRDSFTMPEGEYAVLAAVKQACLKAGVEVKKSELLRIGVALVGRLDMATLRQVLESLPQLKTGRPPAK